MEFISSKASKYGAKMRGRSFRGRLKIALRVYFLLVVLCLGIPGNAGGDEIENSSTILEPEVSAGGAVLMDRESGRVLWGRNIHQRRYMASTTKIMTALVAIQEGELDDVVKVSQKAASVEGSSVYLEAGEEKKLEELLYGLILRSGNDAALAIAEHIGGSVENFNRLMTEKAREIGAENTFFQNPHGLHHDNHYSTAYDLALIASYALENEVFRGIVSVPRAIISWPSQRWNRVLHNQNKLLHLYEGADGVKTGWTSPAGRCFVGSATRAGWQLVVVVLNAPDMWEDAQNLLDYGFNAYERQQLLHKNQELKKVKIENGLRENCRIEAGGYFYYPLSQDELNEVRYKFFIKNSYPAPVIKGELLGTVKLMLGKVEIGEVELVAGEDVDRQPFYQPLVEWWLKS